MKTPLRFLIPPFAFVVFAFIASRGHPAYDGSKGAGENEIRRNHKSVVSAQDPAGVTAVLSRLEREVLHSKEKPAEAHDAAGMDRMLDVDERNAGAVGGGMGSITYALEWADEAPDEMFAWLIRQNATSYARGISQASILFEAWSAKSMSSALAAVPKIPDARIRAQALASTLQNLYPKDPKRALEILEQNLDLFPPGADDSPFTAYTNGVSTCDMLLALPPGPERTKLLADVLPGLALWPFDESAAKAVKVWNDATETQRRELVAAGFSANTDVPFVGLQEMMREHAEASGDSRTVTGFLENYGTEWAETDLSAAFAWSQEHLKGKARVERGAELFKDAAAKDFDGTLAAWKELPEGYLKAKALAAIQRGAPAGREPELKAIIESLPEADRRFLR